MAQEIAFPWTTGLNLYATLIDPNGAYWNTSAQALQAYSAANWSSYAIALSENGVGGYAASFPSGISGAGLYRVNFFQRLGSTTATTDTVLGGGLLAWDGAHEVTPQSLNAVTSRLSFGATGNVLVELDLAQPVPTSNTAQTVGDALNAARAQGFGAWALSGTTLTLYAADGSTVVRQFTLDSASAPTQRT